jgi:hypothetical protein
MWWIRYAHAPKIAFAHPGKCDLGTAFLARPETPEENLKRSAYLRQESCSRREVGLRPDVVAKIFANLLKDHEPVRHNEEVWLGAEKKMALGTWRMRAQVNLLRVFPAQLDEFASVVEIDPSFPEFVRLYRGDGISAWLSFQTASIGSSIASLRRRGSS